MHKELENKMGVIKLKYASIAENDPQDNVELQQKLANQTSKLEENFRRANELLLSQFDEHMKYILPKPEMPPVRLDIVIRKAGK